MRQHRRIACLSHSHAESPNSGDRIRNRVIRSSQFSIRSRVALLRRHVHLLVSELPAADGGQRQLPLDPPAKIRRSSRWPTASASGRCRARSRRDPRPSRSRPHTAAPACPGSVSIRLCASLQSAARSFPSIGAARRRMPRLYSCIRGSGPNLPNTSARSSSLSRPRSSSSCVRKKIRPLAVLRNLRQRRVRVADRLAPVLAPSPARDAG